MALYPSSSTFSAPWLLPPATGSGFDPLVEINGYGFGVPTGDPAAIATAANHVTQLGTVLAEQSQHISSGAKSALTDWIGSAADTFTSYSSQVVAACSANSSACGSAATALTSLSEDLAHAQIVTKQALADCQDADGQVTRHQDAAHAAGQTAQAASTQALFAVHPVDAAAFQRQATQAKQHQADAEQAATAAQADLEAAQRRGRDAYQTYLNQAQAAVTKLNGATGDLRPARELPGAKTTAAAPQQDDGGGGFWGGLTAALIAIDMAQGGLDPVTDGLTLITGSIAVTRTAKVAEEVVATEQRAQKGQRLVKELGPGIDRGDGRDIFGKFTTGNGGYGANAEVRALDSVEELTGQVIIRKQIRVSLPDGSTRYYDGLMKNPDGPSGTYIGLEVKSGSATLSKTQRLFDGQVKNGIQATGILDGQPIKVTLTRELHP